MMRSVRFACAAMVMLFGVTAPLTAAAEAEVETEAGVTLADLKPLEGKWRVKDSDSPLEIRFEWIANETVLIETWSRAGQDHSMTVFHQDGADLIATHYCPQGNQPRLKMTASSTPQQIDFSFLDVTNYTNPQASRQDSLSLTLPNAESDFIRSEVYVNQTDRSENSIILERVPETVSEPQ